MFMTKTPQEPIPSEHDYNTAFVLKPRAEWADSVLQLAYKFTPLASHQLTHR